MDDSVGYTLHQLSARIELLANRRLMYHFGIGFSHYKVLVVLSEHESAQQKVIAEYLLQTEASVSRVVADLETHGFIERFADSFDKRQKIVRLSKQGSQLTIDATSLVEDILRTIFSAISEDERRSFLLSTKKMLHRAAQEL